MKDSATFAGTVSAIALMTAAATVSAHAQTGTDQAGQDDGMVVEEIIVTATKRAASVQDLSLSVSAVGNETLKDQNIVDISGLDTQVPGFQFGQSGNDARPAVRGTRTENVIGNADPLVAFYQDGIYRSRPGQAFAAFVDTQRVEVARGPQGTLFGRNSFGGAINVISNPPVLDGIEAGADVIVQNYDGVRTNGYFNLPLTDSVAVRVAAYRDRRSGFVENISDPGEDIRDREHDYLRGQIRFQPNDRFDATVRLSQYEVHGDGNGSFGARILGVPVDPETGLTNAVDGEIQPRTGTVPGQPGGNGNAPQGFPADPDPLQIRRNGNFRSDINQTTGSADMSYDFDFATARVILSYADYTEYRQSDGDFSTAPGVLNANEVTAETFTEEIQLTSATTRPFEWVVGAYFLQDESSDVFFQFEDNGQGLATSNQTFATTRTTVETNSYAVYADGKYSLFDDLRLVGGVRYTSDSRDVRAVPSDGLDQPIFTGDPSREDEETFDKVTWRGGVEYDVTPDHLLYATVSTGFLAGNFNSGTNPGESSFDEQTVRAVELGSKNRFDLGDLGTLTANLAFYYNDFEDLLAQEFVETIAEDGNVVLEAFRTNAGEVRAFGLEGQLNWRPTPQAFINVNFAYNNSEFEDFRAPQDFQDAPADTLDQEALANGTQVFQLDGLEVPLNPDFTATINAGYNFNLGEWGTVTPNVNFYFSDDYRTSDQPIAAGEQDAFTKTDLRLTWASADGMFEVQGFVENIENEIVLQRTLRFGGDLLAQEFAEPRFYGARFSVRY